jgi:uncharacterized protein YceH (UPF0502 family)
MTDGDQTPALQLTPIEARILGALIEKELTTPEYYPLTFNALLLACSQKSNRDPVMSPDEETLGSGIYSLQDKQLLESFSGATARALKYRERLIARLGLTPPGRGRNPQGSRGLTPPERAILCELLLRGAQTPGELRARASRMHPFTTAEEVLSALSSLAARTPDPLVTELPRQPGQKEARFAHLLGDQPPAAPAESPLPAPAAVAAAQNEAARLKDLGARVAALEAELSDLRAEFRAFKAQFET